MCAGQPMMSCCGMAMMPKMACEMTASRHDLHDDAHGRHEHGHAENVLRYDESHDGLRHADDHDVRQHAVHGLHELRRSAPARQRDLALNE